MPESSTHTGLTLITASPLAEQGVKVLACLFYLRIAIAWRNTANRFTGKRELEIITEIPAILVDDWLLNRLSTLVYGRGIVMAAVQAYLELSTARVT